MQNLRRNCSLISFLALLSAGAIAARAQALDWQASKTNAMALALSQGRLVLLLAGRHTCPNCQYTQGTLCETTSPPIKQLLLDRYVPWFCDVDASTEWYPYATGLGSFTLPLLCCIDPAKPDNYMDRSTDIQSPQPFYDRLLANASPSVQAPTLTSFSVSNGVAWLGMSRLTFGATNVIERSADLRTWAAISSFISTTSRTNWSWAVSEPWAFFRVSSQ